MGAQGMTIEMTAIAMRQTKRERERERDVPRGAVDQQKAARVCVAFVKLSHLGKFVSQAHLHMCSKGLNVHQFKLDFVRLSSALITSSVVELNNGWFNIN